MNFTCKIPDFSDFKINQYLILFILSIALCWLYYQWYLRGQIDYLRTMQDQIASLQHKIRLDCVVKKPRDNNMTRLNQSQIPNYLSHSGDTQAGLLLILNQLIKDNLRLEKLVWLPEQTYEDHIKIPLKLTLSGNRDEIIHVLQSIAQIQDAIEVSWFKIETSERGQQLSLAINFFRQTHKTLTKKAYRKQSIATNRADIKIKDYPLFSLKMLGCLQHRGKRQGLISTPDGLVHSIELGQYIGAEQARVVSIDQNKIKVCLLETKKIIEIKGSNHAMGHD